ncbi:hypothetical protein MRX96_006668 [Rhipicephalus microplus]
MIAKQASRQPLKEKFVQIYEGFFKGVDPSVNNQNFWDELFLLKVKEGRRLLLQSSNQLFVSRSMSTLYSNKFDSLPGEDLVRLKDTINSLFYHCVQALRSDHRIRVVNALQTLCALIPRRDYSHSLKSLVLRFLLVLVTATENVSNNTLLEYVMMNCVFEAILQLLADKHSRAHCGYDAVLVLTILVSYRKYEAANPYIVKLSIVDNELALNGYGMVFVQEQAEPQAGLLSTVTNFVGTMFLADEATPMKDSGRSDDAVLLALYEAVHLNRNFITILTNSQTESCATATAPTSGAASPTEHSPHDLVPVDVNTMDQPPSNLLVTFLEFCSIVMQKTKVEANANTTKLGFIILTCITEDQYANSMMHDVNMVFKGSAA